jgi:hypothetical protein
MRASIKARIEVIEAGAKPHRKHKRTELEKTPLRHVKTADMSCGGRLIAALAPEALEEKISRFEHMLERKDTNDGQ